MLWRFGKYCLISPFVFSFVARSHAWGGVAKILTTMLADSLTHERRKPTIRSGAANQTGLSDKVAISVQRAGLPRFTRKRREH